MTIIIKFLQ